MGSGSRLCGRANRNRRQSLSGWQTHVGHLERPGSHRGVAVREAEIDQSAPLDLLRPDRSLSRPEARYCGTFPPPSGTADQNERYVYERLYLSLVSASHSFLDWVRTTVQRLTGINGSMPAKRSAEKGSEGKHPVWVLRYAKQKSISLLRWIYYAPTVPCLGRKRATAERFLHPLGHASERPVGRPRVGWLYNTRQPGRSEGTR